MTRVRRRSTRESRHRDLNIRELLELTIGPKEEGSAFESDDELRAAWAAHRERLLEKYAFDMHDAGWRLIAYWYAEAAVGPEWVADDWRRRPTRT